MRIVIKIGSGVIADPDKAEIDQASITGVVDAIAAARSAGHEPIVVTSAAVAAGMGALGFSQRPEETAQLQACAAVGQSRLMHSYESAFRNHDLRVGQLLLTHEDLKTEDHSARIMATLNTLIEFGNVIPIINENDSVAVEELRFGDNDALASRVAVHAGAEFLLLLTTVPGLLDQANGGKVIAQVDDIPAAMAKVDAGSGPLSVGGMASKLESVARAVRAGIPSAIAGGRNPDNIAEVIAGSGICTRFPAS